MSQGEAISSDTIMPPDEVPRGLVLVTVSLCTMLYALTLTIVNVVLPQLQGALSATPEQISWVVTLNVIAMAVATPATGWLASRWGPRRVMLWSVAAFSASTMLCAFADSLIPLLVYRIGQGVFGAPLMPLAQAMIVATYPPEKRAFAQGIFGLSVVVGPAIAPAIGGYLAEEYNWRWVFLLVLPLCVLAFVSVLLFIRDQDRNERVNLDWTGFISISIVITCVQLMLDRGEQLDWFESLEVWCYVSLIGASGWVFLVHTFTHSQPFINPQLFRDRNFVIGLLLVFTYGMMNITPTVLMPSMLQNLMGYPDSLIGIVLGARAAGMAVGFVLVGMMGKLDPRIGMVVGISAIGFSGWNMAHFNLETDPWSVSINGIIQGIGSGLMWVPLSIVAFATLPLRLLPDASSIFHLLRNFGSSIFISISVLALVRTGRISYSELSESITPYNQAATLPQVTGSWSFETVPGLSVLGSEINRQAMMIGYINSFALYALVAFSAIPVMLLVRIKSRESGR